MTKPVLPAFDPQCPIHYSHGAQAHPSLHFLQHPTLSKRHCFSNALSLTLSLQLSPVAPSLLHDLLLPASQIRLHQPLIQAGPIALAAQGPVFTGGDALTFVPSLLCW